MTRRWLCRMLGCHPVREQGRLLSHRESVFVAIGAQHDFTAIKRAIDKAGAEATLRINDEFVRATNIDGVEVTITVLIEQRTRR